MKSTWIKTALALAMAATVAACGGGGDDAAAPTASTPPSTGTPTAALSADKATAEALVAKAKSGAAAAGKTQSVDDATLRPLMLPSAELIAAANGTCLFGGTASFGIHLATQGQLTAGDSFTRALSNCSFVSGTAVSGNFSFVITRMVSASDWAVDLNASDWVRTTGGRAYGPVSMSVQLNVQGNQANFALAVDGVRIVGLPSLTVSGSTVALGTGTLRTALGAGWVEVVYSNWVYEAATGLPASGTATLTGANGNTATIVVDGVNKVYRVSITVNGVTTLHVLPLITG